MAKIDNNARIRDKGIGGIKGAVYRGEWRHLGISNWNDLLLHVFGELNVWNKEME